MSRAGRDHYRNLDIVTAVRGSGLVTVLLGGDPPAVLYDLRARSARPAAAAVTYRLSAPAAVRLTVRRPGLYRVSMARVTPRAVRGRPAPRPERTLTVTVRVRP